MRISDWSSDVCSSDLFVGGRREGKAGKHEVSMEQGAIARTAAGVPAFDDPVACVEHRRHAWRDLRRPDAYAERLSDRSDYRLHGGCDYDAALWSGPTSPEQAGDHCRAGDRKSTRLKSS